MNNFKLCYIEEKGKAFFTNNFEKTHGDDWRGFAL